MTNKFDNVIESIIQKTNDNMIVWRRILGNEVQDDEFLRKYLNSQGVEFDRTESFMANYNKGYIYILGDDTWADLAIQPGVDKTLTCIITSASCTSNPMKKLKNIIINKIDNLDDFLKDLLS
ncbi:hypothetical protein [[Clostridium] fimetarium]|uniref:Uncharacterized protein n=1 Tax=[Clostridium] fimetarium TaxID=99656 RepID=A0A1I0RDV1_9FIRM|nr:hypothetical protein [[Clostridium] fimetarium]SEW39036.1 hypothetical protein SAMN05421659_11485 [[Clostridium] fimetarium]